MRYVWGGTLRRVAVSRNLALMLAYALAVTACEPPPEQKIVIPPGGQVQYNTSRFLYYSDDHYRVYLRKATEDNLTLETVFEVTPTADFILDPEVNHSTIVPKGMTVSGMLVVQVDMEYHDTKLYSFVFDEEPVLPGIETTLVYQLLANYPGKSLKSYTREQVGRIQEYIENLAAERMEAFNLEWEMNPDLLYKFLKNSLSGNLEFFALIEDVAGIQFNYDVDGNVIAPPYPFGTPNIPPKLVEEKTTGLGAVAGMESELVTIEALAVDPDGDLLFYAWRREGQVVLTGLTSYTWLPLFNDGRPEPYDVDVLITDGGKVLNGAWQLFIQDVNRRPTILGACGSSATEGSLWFCELMGEDPDFDDLDWVLADSGYSRKPTIRVLPGGAPTPVPAIVTAPSGSSVRIEWTPDNQDAMPKAATLNLRLDDRKLGISLRTIALAITDINSPPCVKNGDVGSPDLCATSNYVIATNVAHDPPHEWDTCLQGDPDGVGDYTFDVVVVDPDNQPDAVPLASPLDVMTVNISGNVGTALSQPPAPGDKDIFPDRSVFHYRWRPNHTVKTASLFIQLSDNHGGAAPPVNINLVAEDRNQMACFVGSPTTSGTLSEVFTGFQLQATAGDGDGDTPLFESYGMDWKLSPFVRDCAGPPNAYANFLQTFSEAQPIYRKQSGQQCFQAAHNINYAGVVLFQRAAPYAGGNITIPAGFKLRSDYGGSSTVRIAYEVMEPVTIAGDVRLVSVPVRAVSRAIAANDLSIVQPAIPNLTVASSAAVTDSVMLTTVTFGRSGAGDITIPDGTILRTNDGSGLQSIRFRVTDNYFFPAAQPTLGPIKVVREEIKLPAGQLTVKVDSLADATLTVSNPVEVSDRNGYRIYGYKATGFLTGDQYCFNTRLFDGATAAVNEITQFGTPNTFGDATLSVNNAAAFGFKGQIQFARTAGNPEINNVVNVPAGTIFKTPNGKRYSTDTLAVLGPTQLTGSVNVSRVMDPSPNPAINNCVSFWDVNSPPLYRNAGATSVFEGNDILDFEIRVTDNAIEEYLPFDPDDRYSFTSSIVGLAPTGTYRLCRTPGNAADPSPITDNCTPCNVTAGYSHHGSRRCYFRYRPSSADIANTFQFQLRVDDGGASFPTGSQVRFQNLLVTVQEQNDPQIFTQSDFTTSVPGQGTDPSWANWAVTKPSQDWGFNFSEGSENTYFFYVYDGDKSLDYKTVTFALDPLVYDIGLGATTARPAGLSIALQSFQPLAGGIGANTTGRLRWQPTDEEAKKFSSLEGFVVRVIATDSPGSPATSCAVVNPKANCRNTAYGYFLFKVQNRNNAPEFDQITTNNHFTWLADTYQSIMIKVRDADAFAPLGGWSAISPHITLCQDANGTAIAHATLDPPPVQPVMDCHAVIPHWPLGAVTYDPSYADNSAVPNCRSGGSLREDLAVPKLTLVNPAAKVGNWLEADYRLEWCPQKGQIGTHIATLYANDNRDEARSGATTSQFVGSTPLTVTVQAPIYFVSPREDSVGDPDHYMVQTAAGLGSAKFRYETLVVNSKGNNVRYDILTSPRACGLENGMCIGAPGEVPHVNDPPRGVKDVPGVITWVPLFPDDVTDPLNSATWHEVRIKVTDTVTAEFDEVHFFLQVDSPVTPSTEMPPVIGSRIPSAGTLTMDELASASFSVSATDPNSTDVIHYRWYVDGVLKSDESPAYTYIPDMKAGSVDPDGVAGPLLPGQHEIKVEATDGNYVAATSWIVSVRNVYLVPEAAFDVVTARQQVGGIVVTNPKWLAETMVHTTLAGKNIDYLLFTGNYFRSPFTKHYVWALQFIDGAISNPNGTLTTPPWNFYEDLPWQGLNFSRRISAKFATSVDFDILITPMTDRMGPFSNSTNSVKLRGDLTNRTTAKAPIPLGAGQVCSGTCARGHYAGDAGYGERPADSYIGGGTQTFYADDSGTKLIWDRNMASPTQFFTGTDPIFDISVNPVIKHLYATTQNVITQEYKVYVFDIAPTESGLPPTSLTPTGVRVGAVGVDTIPTDVISDTVGHRAFIYMAGTGGVAILQDAPGKSSFTAGDMTYVGSAQIGGSPTDTVRGGRRLVFDATRNLIMGVSRLGRQVYTIDGATLSVKVLAADRTFESILTIPESNLTLLVDRDGSAVYRVK